MNIDWFVLPFDHKGKWEKKYDSVMNPAAKVTWPQFIAELVIFNRTKFIKTYKNIKHGVGWSKQISGVVARLNHQSSIICNYFPHPDDEPLIVPAVKNYFELNHPCSIGTFRKARFKYNGNRKVCTISQAEKNTVQGIAFELDKLIKQKSVLLTQSVVPTKQTENITFNTQNTINNFKKSLKDLMKIEEQICQKN